MLPNLIVIGAARCGTTSLHQYLDLHPQVAMSREKELNFFIDGKNWQRGLEWYEAQFDERAAVRGESSPAYSAHPVHPGVGERIARTIPEVRLVYLVRDPIERIVSHHQYRLLNWPDTGSLENALRSNLRERLVAPSRYWTQLQQHLDWTERERIMVVDSDDLRDRRDDTLRAIFGFVGLSFDLPTREHGVLHNARANRTRLTASGRRVSAMLDHALGARLAQAVREHGPVLLKDRFRETAPASELPPRLRAELADELRPEVERLRAYSGLPLAGWSL